MGAALEIRPPEEQLPGAENGPQLVLHNESQWAPYYGIELRVQALAGVDCTLALLKAVRVGSLVRSRVKRGSTISLEVNQAQIGWCELEESGGKPAVRIAEWI